MEINFTFATIAEAILKLFVLVFSGAFLRWRNIIDDSFTDRLSQVLVKMIFPALIFTRTVTNFSFSDFSFWWALPLAAVVFSLSGMALGLIVHTLIRGRVPKNEFMAGCGFHNCGYLPMNIILFSFSGMVQESLLIFLFLFLMGFNLLIWPVLPALFSGAKLKSVNAREIFNPPVLAIALSLLWVWIFGKGSVPYVILDPLRQLGQASFPVAMITLGAYLVRYRSHIPKDKKPVIAGVTAKLFIFPALVLAVIYFAPFGYDHKFFLFLQATMPSAVTLVVIGSYTRADNRYLSSVIFYTHLVSVFTIPVWLGVFKMLMK